MMQAGRHQSTPKTAASSVLVPAATTIVLGVCAFSLSCRIPSDTGAMSPDGDAQSAAGRIAETARVAVGKYFYSQADTFFHRGVGHVKPKAPEGTFFQRLSSTVTPEEHAHLAGQAIKDIMPWLKFAMQADPHNTEFAVVAAFWLAGEGGRPDLAHEVLHESRIDNPKDCELIMEDGRLFVRQGRFKDARRLLDLALRRWPGRFNPAEEDAIRLKREILLYSAFLAEESGERATAIADLRALLTIYPGMALLRQRAQDLENGIEPENSARSVLRNLIASSDRQRGTCEREDHDDNSNEDHAGHNHN